MRKEEMMSQPDMNRRRFLGNSTASLGAAHLAPIIFTEPAAELFAESAPQRKIMAESPECYTDDWQ